MKSCELIAVGIDGEVVCGLETGPAGEKGFELKRVWAGVDIGREHHHVAVVNGDGEREYSPAGSPTPRPRCRR
uniref:hypothetical protein n=1 Tax=Actinomadura sp. CA-154981 TaxID=3240037 RepID=UPI003F49190E